MGQTFNSQKPYLCLNASSRDHQIVIRASSKIGLSELVIDSLFTGRVAWSYLSIPAKVFKPGGPVLLQKLAENFQSFWQKEVKVASIEISIR